MRHGIDHRKLGRKPAHRKALLRNLMNALVHAERIETTVPKAKELRRLADRLITLGKSATLHSRRRVFSLLTDKAATDKVFETLAGRFAGREGGYTRIVRTGYRVGDGAEMAIIEYLPVEEKKAGTKKKKKASAKKSPAKPEVKKKETKEASRPTGRKTKESAPKETKSRTTRKKTQKTPEGG
ncbi:MAG TPA: 50S ribosomal protein L17 [Candidatus Methylomirabilis sp.]|nr:50S ribosomal protein L17 [Candidatus Methylomirabilis sp.]